jgi:hypothetical protein
LTFIAGVRCGGGGGGGRGGGGTPAAAAAQFVSSRSSMDTVSDALVLAGMTVRRKLQLVVRSSALFYIIFDDVLLGFSNTNKKELWVFRFRGFGFKTEIIMMRRKKRVNDYAG